MAPPLFSSSLAHSFHWAISFTRQHTPSYTSDVGRLSLHLDWDQMIYTLSDRTTTTLNLIPRCRTSPESPPSPAEASALHMASCSITEIFASKTNPQHSLIPNRGQQTTSYQPGSVQEYQPRILAALLTALFNSVQRCRPPASPHGTRRFAVLNVRQRGTGTMGPRVLMRTDPRR